MRGDVHWQKMLRQLFVKGAATAALHPDAGSGTGSSLVRKRTLPAVGNLYDTSFHPRCLANCKFLLFLGYPCVLCLCINETLNLSIALPIAFRNSLQEKKIPPPSLPTNRPCRIASIMAIPSLVPATSAQPSIVFFPATLPDFLSPRGGFQECHTRARLVHTENPRRYKNRVNLADGVLKSRSPPAS